MDYLRDPVDYLRDPGTHRDHREGGQQGSLGPVKPRLLQPPELGGVPHTAPTLLLFQLLS